MGAEHSTGGDPIPISQCPICSTLGEVETAYEKYGWEEQTRRLPPAAGRLEPAEGGATPWDTAHDAAGDRVLRCPVCGTHYRYVWRYEYLANGSEDEAELARLTPTEARRFLTDDRYEALIAAHAARLSDPSAAARLYAATCLAAHALDAGDLAAVAQYLTCPDAEVAWGAVELLRQLARRGDLPPGLSPLSGALAVVAAGVDPQRAGAARFVLGCIVAHEEHAGEA